MADGSTVWNIKLAGRLYQVIRGDYKSVTRTEITPPQFTVELLTPLHQYNMLVGDKQDGGVRLLQDDVRRMPEPGHSRLNVM